MQMDIFLPIGLSVNDVNNRHGSCMDALEPAHGVLEDFSVDELGYGVTRFLNIQDNGEGFSGSVPPHGKCVFQTKDVCGESHQSKITTRTPEKCFSKCASFPSSSKTLSFPSSSKTLSSAAASLRRALEEEMNDDTDADVITSEILTHDDKVKSVNPPCLRSLSLPNPLKPVSAMKGSREKQGATPPKKLTLKWAPDVYDPIPTSVSHMVTNRSQRHSKKNSKNKQKSGSKSSRGSKGEDKKHARKRCESSSNMGFKERVIYFSEPQPSALDFVGNPDHICGSSFLKRYVSSLHLSSVAEAT